MAFLVLFAALLLGNSVAVCALTLIPTVIKVFLILMGAIGFSIFMVRPKKKLILSARLTTLSNGYFLTVLSGIYFVIQTAVSVLLFVYIKNMLVALIFNTVLAVLIFMALLFCGLCRIFFTSSQIKIISRILLLTLWWLPVFNLFLIWRICKKAREEIKTESVKLTLCAVRKQNELCKTKYPIVLVHGIFFRDWQLFNYWGRIPAELTACGAELYYGNQQSAAPIKQSAAELSETVLKIIEKTGAEKVNIIAHSKGGLDARYAISRLGLDRVTASLTTINTPHNGSILADNLLKKLPQKFISYCSEKYNKVFHKLGDPDPDFIGGVKDITVSRCLNFKEEAPDMPGVVYRSSMSILKNAFSAPFPLNIGHVLLKRWVGQNGGLVPVDSAKWGEFKGVLTNKKRRGISHGDMIDLGRENIKGFDVREFYVNLVADLKSRGL